MWSCHCSSALRRRRCARAPRTRTRASKWSSPTASRLASIRPCPSARYRASAAAAGPVVELDAGVRVAAREPASRARPRRRRSRARSAGFAVRKPWRIASNRSHALVVERRARRSRDAAGRCGPAGRSGAGAATRSRCRRARSRGAMSPRHSSSGAILIAPLVMRIGLPPTECVGAIVAVSDVRNSRSPAGSPTNAASRRSTARRITRRSRRTARPRPAPPAPDRPRPRGCARASSWSSTTR